MSRNSTVGRAEHLRVAYVWRNEVMGDAVVSPATSVTIGADPDATFTTPDLGLPAGFALLRGGPGGHVIQLRSGMAGRICLAGRTTEVAELAAEPDDFSSAVEPGDWGVIALDGVGDHNLFFQFVPAGPALPAKRWRIDEILAPALAFAVILHAILLTITYLLQDDHNQLLFPGSRDLMTGYLVKRPPPAAPEEEEAPVVETGDEKPDEKPAVVAKKDRDHHRSRPSRSNRPSEASVPQKVLDSGLLKHRDAISDLGNRGFDKDLTKALSRLQDRTASGPGPGRPGGGEGDGPGGGTRGDPSGVEGGGSVIATGDIDTGGERRGTSDRGTKPHEVSVAIKSGTPTGDLGDITSTEIDNVVKSRSGLYRSCYQKQLNRSPHLAGKLVIRFHITADGKVKSAKVVRDKSTLRNDAVEDCVLRHIQRLSFPAKGGAVVNYPLFFSQG